MSEIRTYFFTSALSGQATGAVRKAKVAFGFSLFHHTRPFAPCLSVPQMPSNLPVSPHSSVPSTSTSTNAALLWSVPYASGQLGICVLMGYKAQLVLCMFYKAFRTEAIG